MPAKPHATPPPGLSPSGVWWIWSPPATARSLGGDAARAAVPLLFPEPSVQQDARAPVLTCLVPRAQPLCRKVWQEPFVVPCSSIPVSSPRPGISCRVTHAGPAIIPLTTTQGLWASHGSSPGLATSACARPGPLTTGLRLGACSGPGAPSTLPVLPALRWCYRLPLGLVLPALAHSACVVACPAVMMHRCSFCRTRQRTASTRSTGQPSARQDALTTISRLLPHLRTSQLRALLGSAGAWAYRPLRTRCSFHF